MKKSIATLLQRGIILPILLTGVPALAATCLDGGCHQPLTTPRYLHGPVAAEMAGAKGCVACHRPNGKPCSEKRGGAFTFDKKEKEMCLRCHGKDAATEHTATAKNCLHCHDPHGSTENPTLLRKG